MQIAEIFGVDIKTANHHVLKFEEDGGLEPATIRIIETTRQEGFGGNIFINAQTLRYTLMRRVGYVGGIDGENSKDGLVPYIEPYMEISVCSHL